MKRNAYAYIARAADIVFQPALTPLEAAMLPAAERRSVGALAHARAAFAPGAARSKPRGPEPKLRNWGPQRQKI